MSLLQWCWCLLSLSMTSVWAARQRPLMNWQQGRDLFGKSVLWNVSDWIPVTDHLEHHIDRVRGGTSTSFLEPRNQGLQALMYGHLDTQTLSGAGFASMRTRPGLSWNLESGDGLLLRIAQGDGLRYSLNLKMDESGTASSIEYKFSFDSLRLQSMEFHIPWNQFIPYYRGREKKGSPPLNPSQISSMSIMCASGFNTQKGDYALLVDSISVF